MLKWNQIYFHLLVFCDSGQCSVITQSLYFKTIKIKANKDISILYFAHFVVLVKIEIVLISCA